MRSRLTCIASLTLAAALLAASLRYAVDFWLLAFVNSFQLHIAAAALCGALVVITVLRARRIGALLLVWSLLLFGDALVMQTRFATDATPAAGALPFRLLSFNVLASNGANAGALADAIVASGADAVHIMEARALVAVLPRLDEAYPYRLGCGKGTPACDLVILSKRPLLDARFYSLSDLRRDRFARAAVDLGGTRLTLAAAHVTKPYFDDYHRDELDAASALLAGVTGPLILAGDFNSSTIAPDMQAFLRANTLHTGRWEPATWPVRAGIFGIAIDHVLARKPATLMDVKRLPGNLGSNHYGLLADFMVGS